MGTLVLLISAARGFILILSPENGRFSSFQAPFCVLLGPLIPGSTLLLTPVCQPPACKTTLQQNTFIPSTPSGDKEVELRFYGCEAAAKDGEEPHLQRDLRLGFSAVTKQFPASGTQSRTCDIR